MQYTIGFPVDGGDIDASAIILVRLCAARFHHCKEGGSSGLRPNSGAAFVFARVSPYIAERYRFEFDVRPRPNDSIRPDHFADLGYSDAAACALAVAQYAPNRELSQQCPIILISCAFAPHRQEQGLSNLLLDRVSIENKEESRKSLRNKWEVAHAYKARALVLCEHDAQLLAKYSDIEIVPLRKNVFQKNAEKPYVVSCKADQLPQLATALEIAPHSFSGAKPKKKIFSMAIASSVIAAILAIIWYFWLWILPQLPYAESHVQLSLAGDSTKVQLDTEKPLYLYVVQLDHHQKTKLFPPDDMTEKIIPAGRYTFSLSNHDSRHRAGVFCFYSSHPLQRERRHYHHITRKVPRWKETPALYKVDEKEGVYLVFFAARH